MINPGMSISRTEIWPELKAMALGGVEMGSGIAIEQQNATATSRGESVESPSPITMGMMRFAVAVLLITEDIATAAPPKAITKNDSSAPSVGI